VRQSHSTVVECVRTMWPRWQRRIHIRAGRNGALWWAFLLIVKREVKSSQVKSSQVNTEGNCNQISMVVPSVVLTFTTSAERGFNKPESVVQSDNDLCHHYIK
jgi:hypothetical protein